MLPDAHDFRLNPPSSAAPLSEIPGPHQIISDECRVNRGEKGAWIIACDRLESEYRAICATFPIGHRAKIHLRLSLESALPVTETQKETKGGDE